MTTATSMTTASSSTKLFREWRAGRIEQRETAFDRLVPATTLVSEALSAAHGICEHYGIDADKVVQVADLILAVDRDLS
jgi:hypothetical protein